MDSRSDLMEFDKSSSEDSTARKVPAAKYGVHQDLVIATETDQKI